LRRRPQLRLISSFSRKLPIFLVYNGHDYHALYRALRRHDAVFLVTSAWHYEEPKQARNMKRRVDAHRKRHPGQRFVFLCNTERQHEEFAGAGLEAIFVNHNALLDEKTFRIQPEIGRRFDAIYNAQLLPFERHRLADEVRSLALIAYKDPGRFDAPYALSLIRELEHAHWFNNPLDPAHQ
jgi:hypothetical protein